MTRLMTAPGPSALETVPCYLCGSTDSDHFITAQDDLTGKPGDFTFVECRACGLVYQNPRVTLERIIDYYDDNYIAHRRQTNWGVLTPIYHWAMNKLDRDKDKIVRRYVSLGPDKCVLDAGCGAGTFLAKLVDQYQCEATGIDFKDLSQLPSFKRVAFQCGLFYELPIPDSHYDLVTMWHFLEHDYDPLRSLDTARRVTKPDGRLILEIPRLDSLTFRMFGNRWPGLQAPQHTVVYTKEALLRCVDKTGWEVVDYLPYGAFPAYFYLFCGVAFKMMRGKGINLSKAIYPYFLGQLIALPITVFERQLNLAMQTVVCKKK